MAIRDSQTIGPQDVGTLSMGGANHPQDVALLGLEDSDIVRLQDGRIGTKEELGIIGPRRPGQVDSEPARSIEQPPPSRAARLAVIEEQFQGGVSRTAVHAEDSPTATGVILALTIREGEMKGTVISVEGSTMDDATDKLEAKMLALGEALLS